MMSPNLREWSPTVHVPGKRFMPVQERELDPALRSLAARLPGARSGVVVTAEFPGADGLADLVAVTHSATALAARMELPAQSITGVADASVAAAVAVRRTTTAATVAGRTGMTIRQAERRLRALTTDGLLTRSGAGFRRDAAVVPIGRLYAFEAKVSDWRGGMRQALRYGGWADASAVVLLNPPRDLGEARETAARFGLGLAVSDRWLVRPRIHPVAPGPRLLASERLVETLRHQRPSAEA
jgi:hypothetical protein